MPFTGESRSTFLAGVLVALLGSATRGQAIEFKADPGVFVVNQLPAEHVAHLARLTPDDPGWTRALAVYVRDPAAPKVDRKTAPAMAGTYLLEKNQLRFTPRFPLRPGLTYGAVLTLGDQPPRSLEISLPKPAAGPPARVTQIYPSADVLPENQLRFYLHFSAPMSRGEAYDHLHIVDENNKAAELPILELAEELWDKSGTRLTILIDPGRIKRGVKPREDIGTVFKSGGKYTLSVAKEWRDAAGQPLAEGFRKSFRISAPIDKAIEPADWKITPGAVGTRDPLVVRFPRPLDHALLVRTLSVAVPRGKTALAGQVTVPAGEERWEFRPNEPWAAGPHELVVEPTLEDLAGNRIGRPFEVLGGDQPTGGAPGPIRIPLTVGR